MATPSQTARSLGRGVEASGGDFEALKRLIHGKLVDKLDLSPVGRS